MKSFALNLLIALVWLLLGQEPSPVSFGVGFLLGFGLLWLFRPVLGSQDYLRRCFALGRFVGMFLWAFLAANLTVAVTVLFRSRATLSPNFFTYDVAGLKPFEILLLTYCITLTPGTTSVDISPDFRTLTIHALDAGAPDAIRADLDRTFKPALLAFTR